jgi:transposase
MPQVQLPIFSEGVTPVTADLAFERRDGRVTYFNGTMPVFTHDEDDLATFRMITSQFVVNGNASQAEISRAFGIPKISVKRGVRRYREKGPRGFYEPRRARGAAVLTPDVLERAQSMLDAGETLRTIGESLGVKPNTVNKAILAGKLHRPTHKKKTPFVEPTDTASLL